MPTAPPGSERHPPEGFAGVEVVGVEAGGTEDDELLGSTGGPVDHRSGPTNGSGGAIGSPALAAGFAIQGQKERSALLIANHDQQIAGYDRRCGHAVEILERTKWEGPAILTLCRVGGEAEIGEEDDHSVLVGDGSGRGWIVGAENLVRPLAQDFALPQLTAGFRVEADGEQFVAFGGREVDSAGCDDGRRLAVGNRLFPNDIFGGGKFDWVSDGGIDAGAVGSTELGPMVIAGGGEQRQKRQGAKSWSPSHGVT